MSAKNPDDRQKLIADLRRRYGDHCRAKREQSTHFFGLTGRGKRAGTPRAPDALRRNLVGIGVAEKRTKGRRQGVAAITFYVRKKLPKARLTKNLWLPDHLEKTIPCDVVQVGSIRAAAGSSPSSVQNPLVPGCQIGVWGGLPGTLGGFVRDSSGSVCLVTNCHVVSPDGSSAIGTPIFQPAPGWPGSRHVATVTQMTAVSSVGRNTIDVAFARLEAGTAHSAIIPSGIGSVSGLGMGDPQDDVEKVGARTLFTSGDIESIDTDVDVEFEDFTALFASVLTLSPISFADRGDSGSFLVRNGDSALTGLMFAVAANRSFAIPIQAIDANYPNMAWL